MNVNTTLTVTAHEQHDKAGEKRSIKLTPTYEPGQLVLTNDLEVYVDDPEAIAAMPCGARFQLALLPVEGMQAQETEPATAAG